MDYCRPPQHPLDVPTLYIMLYDNATIVAPECGVGVRLEANRLWSAPGPAFFVNVSFFNLPVPARQLRLALRMPSWTNEAATVDVSKNGGPAPSCPSGQAGNFCILIDSFSEGA